MTLDERVQKITDKCTTWPPPCRIEVKHIICRALIEQDKITRYAGAEDIIMLDTTNSIDGDGDVVDIDKAYAAVMNCRGGIE